MIYINIRNAYSIKILMNYMNKHCFRVINSGRASDIIKELQVKFLLIYKRLTFTIKISS